MPSRLFLVLSLCWLQLVLSSSRIHQNGLSLFLKDSNNGEHSSAATFAVNHLRKRKLQVTGALDWPRRQYDDTEPTTIITSATSPPVAPVAATSTNTESSISQESFHFILSTTLVIGIVVVGILIFTAHHKRTTKDIHSRYYHWQKVPKGDDGSLTSDNSNDSDLELVETP